MNDKIVFFATLGGGTLLSSAYMLATWFLKKQHPQFLNVAMIFGSTLGLVSGVKLCYTLCADETKFIVGYDDKIAIFIGGLAICWVSVLGIIEGYKCKTAHQVPHSK